MDAVGTGLDGGIQNRARGTAELGAEVRRLHLELLDRVQGGKDDEVRPVQEVDSVGVIVDAVQQVVVLRGTQAVRREGAGRCVAAGVCLRCVDPGCKLRKECKVAAVQWQAVHGALVDDLPDRSFVRLELRRCSRYLNRL